ncbi:CRISPR-associated helicase Cas3' [Anoxynatronum sibiricum]|uniref:CRISPR-associated helicase Cas3 n=1 Tax=Anoxynatronum sibiricum TaxID=210623 RepID=A0ABU9VUW2_9CLOT
MSKQIHDKEQTNQFVAHYRREDGTIQDVWSHLANVSDRAAANASKISLQEPASLCGLVHDLGKASQAFNDYIRSAEGLPTTSGTQQRMGRGSIDHSTAGAQWLYQHLKAMPGNVLSRQLLPLITASHHSELIDCLAPDGENRFLERMDKDKLRTHYDEVMTNLPDDFKEKMYLKAADPALEQSLHLVINKVMEAEDDRVTRAFKLGLLTRMLFSTLLDADRVDTIDHQNPTVALQRPDGQYISWITLTQRLEATLSQFTVTNDIDRYRQQVSERCREMATQEPGVFRLTVPTGGGKTLASLRFALHHAQQHQMDRIIYVVPYTAIIDQNARTIRNILETEAGEPAIVMEHHSNLDPRREVPDNDHFWTQNWDAPVVLTTMVQFLESFFGSGTGPVRRLHQMTRAVIIFDEIQSLPVRCTHMVNLAIRFLVKACHSTVVLCTATQPLLEAVQPASRALSSKAISEITPDVKALFQQFKRVKVNDETHGNYWTHEVLAGKIMTAAETTASVLAIFNTKKDAALVYDAVDDIRNETGSETKVFHLSTHMCPAHRRQILEDVNQCLNEKKPVICISTQLIEAGVDIDFTTVFRALAGLDSIQQAAGRCNRHGKISQGQLFLFQLQNENLSRLTDIREGKEVTLRLLNEYHNNPGDFDEDLLSAKAMNRYYEYYFYQRQSEMSYPLPRSAGVGNDSCLFDLLAENPQAVGAYQRINGQSPDMLLRQSFQTAAKAFQAIDKSTQGVIVPYGEEGERIIKSLCGLSPWDSPGELLKLSQQYAVNCYAHELNRLVAEGALHETTQGSGIYYLNGRHYSREKGLQLQGALQTMDTMTF